MSVFYLITEEQWWDNPTPPLACFDEREPAVDWIKVKIGQRGNREYRPGLWRCDTTSGEVYQVQYSVEIERPVAKIMVKVED